LSSRRSITAINTLMTFDFGAGELDHLGDYPTPSASIMAQRLAVESDRSGQLGGLESSRD
jgi:hypothetical protein